MKPMQTLKDSAANCRLLAGLLPAILVAGALLSWWMAVRADREMRQDLLGQTRLAAEAVNLDRVPELSGTSVDLTNRAYLRMLREPMPTIPLVPTGGVTLETLYDYFEAGAVFVGTGGDLVDQRAAEAGELTRITERSRQYVEAIRVARASLHS